MAKTIYIIISSIIVGLFCIVAFALAIPFTRDYVFNQVANSSSNYKSTVELCTDLTNENSVLKVQKNTLSSDLEILTNEFNSATNNFGVIYQKIDLLFNNAGLILNADTTEESELAQLKLGLISDYINNLRNETYNLQNQVIDLQNQVFENSNNIDNLNTQIANLYQEINAKNIEIDNLNMQITTLSHELNITNEKFNTLSNQIDSMFNKIGMTLENPAPDIVGWRLQQLQAIETYLDNCIYTESYLRDNLYLTIEQRDFYQEIVEMSITSVGLGVNADLLTGELNVGKVYKFLAPHDDTFVFSTNNDSDFFRNINETSISSTLTVGLQAGEVFYFVIGSANNNYATLNIQTYAETQPAETFTVTFIVNNEIYYTYESERGVNVILPTSPEPISTFRGWAYDPNAEFPISVGDIIVSADFVFYALFE